VKSSSFDEQVAASTALARLGNRDPLQNLLREIWSGDSADPSGEKYVNAELVLGGIADVADETFLPQLNDYFQRCKNEELKLHAASTIASIIRRREKG
jgi:hypothetical protein